MAAPFTPPTTPPSSEEALLLRAHAMAGLTLGQIAEAFGAVAPHDLKRAKGFVGQLVEQALGANASSLPLPDFVELGVELKTLPIDASLRPKESTFVCSIEMAELAEVTWEESRVRKKLARVLWLPVDARPEVPVADRRVGTALLWSPSEDQAATLRSDFESHAALIRAGYPDALTAHRGEVLQVRPKAASASVRRHVADEHGDGYDTLPRGFYLRRSFTSEILANAFHGSG